MGEAYLFIKLLVYTTLIVYTTLPISALCQPLTYTLLSDNLPADRRTPARQLSRQLLPTYTHLSDNLTIRNLEKF